MAVDTRGWGEERLFVPSYIRRISPTVSACKGARFTHEEIVADEGWEAGGAGGVDAVGFGCGGWGVGDGSGGG